MPLEQPLRQLSKMMGASFPPIPSADMTAAEARRRAHGRSELTYSGTVPPASERLAVDWRGQTLDYLTLGLEGSGRAVLFLHSGGWVAGSAGAAARACAALAHGLGATVLALNYPLAPEHPYPAALDAVAAAIDWMSSADFTLAGKSPEIVIAGESAGGNLVAAWLLRQRDAGAAPAVSAAILLVPVLDHDFTRASYERLDRGDIDGRSGMHWYAAQYLADRFAELSDCPYAWPLRAESVAGLPPIVLVQAQYDPMGDEQEEFCTRVRAEGGVIEHLRYEGVGHSFFGLDHLSATAGRAQSDVCAAISRQLPSRDPAPETRAS